jgi:Fic family protein
VGRLLVILLMVEWGLLPAPLLDLSAYIEPRRDQYYADLLGVSTEGDWTGWLRFFLAAVEHQSADAAARAQRLQALRDDFRARVASARSSGLLGVLVDELFSRPAITITGAAKLLGVTYRAARLNIDKLVDAGVLSEIGDRPRRKLFWAEDVLDAIEGRRSGDS